MVTLKTGAGGEASLEDAMFTLKLSRVDALRTRVRGGTFSIHLDDISRVLVSPPSVGGKLATGWIWLLRHDDDQAPAKASSMNPLFFGFFSSHEQEAEAFIAAIAAETDGRLAPVRVTSNALNRISYTTMSDDDEPAELGKVVARESFGKKTITIYERGFVKLASPIGGGSAKPERLLSIEASTDLAKKKSAFGRTAGFVATGGVNMLFSNKKGDVFLTIATDQQVHVLKSPAMDMTIKALKKLDAAGNAVLSAASTNIPAASAATTPSPSLADEVRSLSELRDAGVLSEEEFVAAKAKLLGQ